MTKIVKIVPSDSYFSFTWMVGTRCNYDCMYCPTEFHNDTSTMLTLEQFQQRWSSVYERTQHKNLNYKISFTGGEATINKNFKPFLQWLRQNYGSRIFQIILSSNGSASTKYYQELYQLVDNISFSFHSEHADEQKFFSMIQELKNTISPSRFVHVNIMDEFWNQERIGKYTQFLNKNKISYSVSQINYAPQTRTFPILKGQQNFELI